MKKILLAIVFIIALTSCGSSKYSYVYALKAPVPSNKLLFADEKIAIAFTANDNDFGFTLKNNSDKPIKVIWDDASFVNRGEAQKIIHKNIKFIDKEKSQSGSVIPPSSYINDIVQPIDEIEMRTYMEKNRNILYWSKNPLLPTSTSNKKAVMQKYLGSNLTIYLPLQYDSKTYDYYFSFEVTDILLKKGNKSKSIFSNDKEGN